jgi:hypothetical protein
MKYAPAPLTTSAGGVLRKEAERTDTGDDEWEADRLLELVSHDLINQQQAALGFLELLGTSEGLSEGDHALVSRTVEVLERTGRLALQVRSAMVDRERVEFRPRRIPVGKPLKSASHAVRGAFALDRLSIEVEVPEDDVTVLADAMLAEMLTQLLLLLSERAPPDRRCSMRARVEPMGPWVALRFSSEGFPLNPMVIDTLVGDRRPLGGASDVGTVTLVRHLLRQYGGKARTEAAPAGEAGAHLVIELPSGGSSDAVDNDSR